MRRHCCSAVISKQFTRGPHHFLRSPRLTSPTDVSESGVLDGTKDNTLTMLSGENLLSPGLHVAATDSIAGTPVIPMHGM